MFTKSIKLALVLMFLSSIVFVFAQTSVDLGEGNLVNGATSIAPINIYYQSSRTQTVYTADEINAMGFAGPADIEAIGYFVTGIPIYNPPNFKIRIKHTTANNASQHDAGPFTLAYTTDILGLSVNQWNMFEFITPFAWNGVDNLLIDTSFDLTADWNQSGQQKVYEAANGMRYVSSDDFNTGEMETTDIAPYKPQVRINFDGGTVIENDFAAIAISGQQTVIYDNEYEYTVTIKNFGVSTHSDYTVYLITGDDDVLAEIEPGIALAQRESLDVTLSWTPDEVGLIDIWGYVSLPGDTNHHNNATGTFPVQVFGENTSIVQVGFGEASNNYLPANFYWKNSLSQSLYMPSELEAGGELSHIAYFNDFVTNLPDREIKIWVGETMLQELTGGWIPASDLTLVFEGAVNFPVGQNEILIPLDNSFTYYGSNLVVMVQRVMEDNFYSTEDGFFFTDTAEFQNRSRYISSDTVILDPENPGAGSIIARIPNTKFIFDTEGMGSVSGTVVDSVTENPIAGARVEILEINSYRFTDDNGNYSFNFVYANDYTLAVSNFAYYNYTEEIVVTSSQNTEVNVDLVLLPLITVSGVAIPSDAPQDFLSDARVLLSGYDDYEVVTGANGAFAITDVYTNQVYNLTIKKLGYQDYNAEVVVVESNVDLGVVMVNELAFPVSNVVATELGEEEQEYIELVWNEASDNYGEFRYDDGVVVSQLGFTGGTTNSVMGTVWRRNAIIDKVSWYLTDEVDPYDTVIIRIMGLNLAGNPDRHNVIAEYTNVPNVHLDWNVFELPEALNLEGGFFVGISAPGFLALATDDGTGAPWSFNNRTMYYSFNYTTTNFTATESGEPAFRVNYLLRAYGWDFGPLTLADDFAASEPVINSQSPVTTVSTRNSNIRNKIITNNPLENILRDRELEYYDVYRLLRNQEDNTESWVQIASEITDTTFVDDQWTQIDDGWYRWSVVAVYTSDVYSLPMFSNILPRLTIPVFSITPETYTFAPRQINTTSPEQTFTIMNEGGALLVISPENITLIDNDDNDFELFNIAEAVQLSYGETVSFGVKFNPETVGEKNAAIQIEDNLNNDPRLNQTRLANRNKNNRELQIIEIFGTAFDATISEFPWSETFEDEEFPPLGWNVYNVDGGGVQWTQSTSQNHTPDGTRSAFHNYGASGYAEEGWLVTPPISLDEAELVLRFWSFNTFPGDYGNNSVHISTGSPNPADEDFVMIWSADSVVSAWVETAMLINEYANDTIYLGFKYQGVYAHGWFLDDISLALAPTEPEFVLNPEAHNYGTQVLNSETNATFTLRNIGGGLVTINPEDITLDGDDRDDFILVGITTPITLAFNQSATVDVIFNPQTEGEKSVVLQVEDNIAVPTLRTGNRNTERNIAISRTRNTEQRNTLNNSRELHEVPLTGTAVDATISEFPWTESFEGEMFPPLGWRNVDNDGDGQKWFPYEYVPHTGQLSAASASYWDGVELFPDNWLISPPIELNTPDLMISYWVAAQNAAYPEENYSLYISTTGNQVEDFTNLLYTETLTNNFWQNIILDLSFYTGNTVYFAFVHHDCTDMYIFKLDSIIIDDTLGSNNEELAQLKTELRGNYPNPFNPETNISFSLKEAGSVTIDIFNIKGQKVKSLLKDELESGQHNIVWNGRNDNNQEVGSGVFFYRMKAGDYNETKKMMLIK